VRVQLLVRLDLMLDTNIYATMGILAWVRGPQSGGRLCHCADHILHIASLYGFLMGIQSSIMGMFGKDLEQGDRVIPCSEVRFNIVFQAEHIKTGPMVAHWFDALCGNTSLDPLVDSDQVSAELMGLRNWESCQGIIWVK
jgi:hypothetical protein